MHSQICYFKKLKRCCHFKKVQVTDTMKVPPTNNSINGFDSYEEEPYFTDGSPTHAPIQNGVEEFIPPVEESDFSEYMWMENEEEFDKEVMQRLEEEELMEQCMLQHMLEDEHTGGVPIQPSNLNDNDTSSVSSNKTDNSDMAKSSTLNPHAAEFIPSWRRASADSKSS